MAYEHDPADPQYRLVYALERMEFRAFYRHKAPQKWMRRQVKRICKRERIPLPKVSFRPLNGYAGVCDMEDGQGILVFCSRWGSNGMTLAHELAHWICWMKYPRAQSHGPTFCAIYARLLWVLRVMPEPGFRIMARRYGIKVASL